MKKCKKVLAAMLAMVMVFSLSSMAFALDAYTEEVRTVQEADGTTREDEIVDLVKEVTIDLPQVFFQSPNPEDEQILTTENTPEEPSLDALITSGSPLIKMYLCATARTLTGHVWIYFVNLTDYELPVGYATLLPGESMSCGSLRNTRTDGGGTYYNGEAYMAKSLETTGKSTTYLSMEINWEQLMTVNSVITDRNSYNIFVNNCGNFAAAVWNSVSSKKIVHIMLPVLTIGEMEILGADKGFVMSRPDISRVFKQTDNGIKQADPKSFKTSCV